MRWTSDNLHGWTGVVLCGGRSSRMGQDKALLTWPPAGRTLLEHALDRLAPQVEELLVVGDPAKHGEAGPFVVPDLWPGSGPLGGLLTAMRYATHDRLLVLAVDMPLVDASLLERLKNAMGNQTDSVVPRRGERWEPLSAAYHRRCSTVFETMFHAGERRMVKALEQVRTTWVEFPTHEGAPFTDPFLNLNRPQDLDHFRTTSR